MKKIENECGIVEDLLPLYTEGMAGKESVRFIEAHIEECESCRAEAERMKAQKTTPEQDIHNEVVPLVKMQKIIKRRRNRSVLLAVLILIAVFFAVFSNLTAPRYFDYSDNVVSVSVTDDGYVYLSFSNEVTDWEIDRVKNDGGRDFYTVTAYYSFYDRLIGKTKKSNVYPMYYPVDAVIMPDEDGEIPILYYVQNNGEDDACLSGDSSEIGMVRTLPRLVLGYYLLIASGCLILLLVVYLLFRRKEAVAAVIKKIILLPISYIAAHIAIKGFVTVSYSAIHDFIYIVITASVIYAAVLVMSGIIKERNE